MFWAVVEDEEENAAEIAAAAKPADAAAAAAGDYSPGKQPTTVPGGKRPLKKVKTMFFVGTEVGSAYLFSVLFFLTWQFLILLPHDSIYAIARYMSSPIHLSVCLFIRLSITRVDQSKMIEVRITQPSPQSSPVTLVSRRLTSPWNSKGKIRSGGAEWQRGSKNTQFSANKSPYLRNGAR